MIVFVLLSFCKKQKNRSKFECASVLLELRGIKQDD